MTSRSQTLDDALAAIASGKLENVSRIVVNRAWWDALSLAERSSYRKRCGDHGVELSADDRISRHFVEVVNRDEPPLSSERRV
ncbi:MAG TPA: hypothetical protein VFZ21_30520 [Gemmatimonadaceae bacterium]|nr:hypothetical protein [Gemmatimonadaceae bacterium]